MDGAGFAAAGGEFFDAREREKGGGLALARGVCDVYVM